MMAKTVFPAFIVATAVGAWLESRAPLHRITHWLQSRYAIPLASVLGALLPGCACATIPLTEGLLRRGATLGTLATFMLTSPLLAPQTIILTYGLLGPHFAIGRVSLGLVGGIGIGGLVALGDRLGWLQLPNAESPPSSCCSTHPETQPSFVSSFLSILKKLSLYLVIGLVIASALTVVIPPDIIPAIVARYPKLIYIIPAVIGIPVYICEGEEIPITVSLIQLGLPDGPAMTFLLGAVGTCIPTLIFAKKLLGFRTTLVYGVYWALFAPLAGWVFGHLY